MAYMYQQPYIPYRQDYSPQPNCGFSCRPVASKEEAMAVPIDYMSDGIIMPNFRNGYIYVKQFNLNTGSTDFMTFGRMTDNKGQDVSQEHVMTAAIASINEKLSSITNEIEAMKQERNSLHE